MNLQDEAGLAPSRLDPTSSIPLYRQIYDALREEILGGRLRPGARVRSTRALAAELVVSRNTVVLAIDQLIAEGYLEGRRGAGTFVRRDLPEDLLQASPAAALAVVEAMAKSAPAGLPELSTAARVLAAMDLPGGVRSGRAFQPGQPALDAFPRDLWARLAAKSLRRLPEATLGYGEVAGYRPLREALAAHLGGVRGLRCTADQILIVSGSQQGLDLASRVLLDTGARVWVEDPGYPGARAALCAARAKLVSVAVDAEGLRVEDGRATAPDARLAVVAPSHQYPLGVTLSLGRRLELLAWASEAEAWVLEDDYDSELRYSGRPLQALKSLDTQDRVLYLGTFSKVLCPAIRLGYLVLPDSLIDPFRAMRFAADRQSAVADQAVVAELLAAGHLARHLRRMRVLYEERQQVLLEAVANHLGGLLEVGPDPAGMHVIGWLPDGVDDVAASWAAAEHGVTAPALTAYHAGGPEGPGTRRPGLVLGYAGFDPGQIRAAVERLAEALEGMHARP